MSRIRKRNTFQDLSNILVYKNDTLNQVFNILNIPSVFTRGKNHFLIGGSDLLRQGSEVKVEITDSEGNVIYSEYPFYIESGNRAVSVWVYSDNSKGIGLLTVLGELIDVPKEWKNKFNVKYQEQIFIDPDKKNISEIKFVNTPEITVEERIKKYVSYTDSKTTLKIFNTGEIYGVIPGIKKTVVRKIPIVEHANLENYEIELQSPVSEYPGDSFIKEMVGGKIKINDPKYITSSDYFYTSSQYTASIIDIKNYYTLVVSPPAKILNKDLDRYEIVPFNVASGQYDIEYVSEETGSDSVFTSSYARFDLTKLQTFSGKINSIRIYKKSLSTETSYNHIGDYLVEPRELLLQNTDFNPVEIGIFDTSSKFNYWTTSSVDSSAITSNLPTMSLDNYYLFNSIKLSRTDDTFKMYSGLDLLFSENHEYTLSAKFATKLNYTDTSLTTSSLSIYVSGSAFSHDFSGDKLGKKIGTITSNEDQIFNFEEFNFITDNIGTGNISFHIDNGEWYISEISLKPAFDSGFSPDETTLFVPLNNTKRNDILIFKIQYLTSDGKISDKETEINNPVRFIGQPTYILENDNLLSGSLSIGNNSGSGIEIFGQNGAYIRSTGYNGFYSASNFNLPGFIIYSGSILSESGDLYRGLGLELHAGGSSGSLRYRVDNSGSFLEISGTLYAESGKIGGFSIGTYELSASYITNILTKIIAFDDNYLPDNYTGFVVSSSLGWSGLIGRSSFTITKPTIFAGAESPVSNDAPFWVNMKGELNTEYIQLSNDVQVSTIQGDQELSGSLANALVTQQAIKNFVKRSTKPVELIFSKLESVGSSSYLNFGNVASSNINGYLASSSGSVIFIGLSADFIDAGNIFVSVRKNGSDLFTVTKSITAETSFYETSSEGSYTFARGDVISTFVSNSSGLTWENPIATIELMLSGSING